LIPARRAGIQKSDFNPLKSSLETTSKINQKNENPFLKNNNFFHANVKFFIQRQRRKI
jgi:hypothetical protein